MNTRKTRLTLSVLLAVFLIAGVVTMPVAAAGNSSATGGGTTDEGGLKSTFVFNAVQKKDGTVTGHLVYHFRLLDVTIKYDLHELCVVGNVATMSGVVTEVSGELPPFITWIFVGQDAVFQVQDNGEGAGADPDMFSDVFFYEGASCGTPPVEGFTLYLPVSGNIQVR